jgi:hypothetical protein
MLPGDKRSAPGGAALLGIVISEQRAFIRDAVNVGRSAAHHPAMVGANIPHADVIRHNDDDVRFFLLGICSVRRDRNQQQNNRAYADYAYHLLVNLSRCSERATSSR